MKSAWPKKEVLVKSELPKKDVVVKSELHKKDESNKPIFTVDISSMECTMHSTSENAEQSVPLETGPNGLLVANCGETVHTTELCNLMLFAALKKR